MDPLTGMPNNGTRFGLFTNVAYIQNAEIMDYINSLDSYAREKILEHHGEFQSREEIERYLDHLEQEDQR